MSDSIQLTSASGYNTSMMSFSEPFTGAIPGSNLQYKRISILTQYPDGSQGPLILPTERVFSFGVSENIDQGSGKVNGYTLPLCLWNRDGPTKNEKEWTTTFDNIVERCKDHVLENREELGQYELERSDLKKLNPLYWKREKGKIVEGTGPTLYAKLIVSKKQEKIISEFYDQDNRDIDPLSLKQKYCTTKAAVKIESIFIGTKISLQVKICEAEIKLMQSGIPRLMRQKADTRVLAAKQNINNPLEGEEEGNNGDDNEDDNGDYNGDIQADTEEEEEEKPKKIVRRKVKKAVRKSGV